MVLWTNFYDIEIDEVRHIFEVWKEIDHTTVKNVYLTSHITGNVAAFEYKGHAQEYYRKLYCVTPQSLEAFPMLEKWYMVFVGKKELVYDQER